MKKTVVALSLLMAACTTTPSVSNDVAAAEVTLTGLEHLAVIYTKLPRCGPATTTKLCSDQATVDKVKSLDDSAFKAVMAARQNSALLSDALMAIGAFKSAIPTMNAN